ncbi:apolipoprotein N-acyltransferase [Notoacmeibacter ruber]|uniref:Apolipoprotein N-acyltransferase n=1 Tax=Notoacmeibacter ruber TaxID=2670375 RepID=A0A3L7JET0_9HYPH|nr:apolipoprotein N-acyltransferase [Notoacmeibacter ruber]RLQ86982.1 apolipoprotein N-acyltransferase [Notoacmeibacter ruber]
MLEDWAGRIVLLSGWRRNGLSLLAGALGSFAQAPYDFPFVCFVSFPILVLLLDGIADGGGAFRARIIPAFCAGFWFGFGWFAATLWWIGAAFFVEAELHAWMVPIGVIILPAILACFYGVATALARFVWADDLGRLFALAAAFGALEWLRTFLFTGFPWAPVAAAAMPVPLLMQPLPFIGMTGMNALATLLFSLPVMLVAERWRRTGLALLVLLLVAQTGFGAWRMWQAGQEDAASNGDVIAMRIVQPAILQNEKWDDETRTAIFDRHIALSKQEPENGEPPQLIVWPETAAPWVLTSQPLALLAIARILDPGQFLLTGAVRAKEEGSSVSYTNAVLAIDDTGTIVDAADKVQLVPLGEYLPLADLFARFGLTELAVLPGGFKAGSRHELIELPGLAPILPLICYETIFPQEAAHLEENAGFLLNVTNDAWFGDTPGPAQHFRLSQYRAVLAARPVVRAANNGISGLIDPYGRVRDGLALNATGILDIDVSRTNSLQPWVYRSTVGIALLVAFGLLAFLLTLPSRRGLD